MGTKKVVKRSSDGFDLSKLVFGAQSFGTVTSFGIRLLHCSSSTKWPRPLDPFQPYDVKELWTKCLWNPGKSRHIPTIPESDFFKSWDVLLSIFCCQHRRWKASWCYHVGNVFSSQNCMSSYDKTDAPGPRKWLICWSEDLTGTHSRSLPISLPQKSRICLNTSMFLPFFRKKNNRSPKIMTPKIRNLRPPIFTQNSENLWKTKVPLAVSTATSATTGQLTTTSASCDLPVEESGSKGATVALIEVEQQPCWRQPAAAVQIHSREMPTV